MPKEVRVCDERLAAEALVVVQVARGRTTYESAVKRQRQTMIEHNKKRGKSFAVGLLLGEV